MFRRSECGLAWVSLVWLAVQSLAAAAEPATKTAAVPAKSDDSHNFVRLDRNPAKQPVALKTAIVRFVPDKPGVAELSVDLVGAVHVGEKSYYQALNEAFRQYDVVLYELVAPPGTRIPRGGKSEGGNPVAAMQNGMKNMLGLEHQLEWIDYNQKNLVHADMSPADVAKSMQDRGESVWGLFFRMLGQGMAQQAQQQSQGKSTDVNLWLALFDKDRDTALKRVMAEQFEEMGGAMQALDGPQGSTIITERNKVALQGLAKQIAAGKKRIAIFYGAGHMPDMEKRLASEFGLKRSTTRWLIAWNLGDAGGKSP